MKRIGQGLLLLALAGAYVPAFVALAHAWQQINAYAGHGMFVPMFAAVIAWSDRHRIRSAAQTGQPGGLVAIAGGLILLAIGSVVDSFLLQTLSVTLTVGGVVWFAFGLACVRAAAFPIAFLTLMAPLPHPVVAAVTEALQRFVARFAAAGLRMLDIPVYQVGNSIELANTTLQVAEVCNGLRFLAALVVMTAAFAYVTQVTFPRRLVLTISAVPVAIVANAVRVAAIAVAVQYLGPEAAKGFIHNMIGKSIWALTIGLLVALGYLLHRMPASGSPEFLPEPELGAPHKSEVAG